jgi:aspartyl-tRNA(Asn)/glutamyl-tRNA(Gln) amidotransferase subunit A
MVAGGKLSAVEAVNGALDRIRSAEGRINAFNSVFEEHALKRAETMDRKILAGENPGLLAGVPVAVKDNICIRGFKTTCSSKMLENYISPYDATVIGMLEKSGAIIVGKTNMDEFAMGSSTENSAFKKTRNPWNPDYIPGGSSGGSAAAVAAGIVPIALGSDTGGSIRQPASCCGIVGFKPTYGRVSRYGLVAFASSLDQIGSFTRDVEDCALALEIISGNDPKDSTSSAAPAEKYAEEMKKGIKGIKIGIPDEYFIPGMDPEVRDAVDKAVLALEKQGAVIERISLPHTEYAVAVYYIIAPCEASANLARYDGVRYGLRAPGDNLINVYGKTRGAGFGQEVKRRIMLGTYALSAGYYEAYYGKAQKVRTLIKGDFDKAFAKVDVIVTPTAPTAAFKIGEKTGNPLMMYLSDIFTIPCNLAGLPGVSLPCGFTGAGLPVGFQILGEPFGESLVLRAAFAYQSGTDWHKRTPEGLWN